jgi:hypothetical protein
MSSCPTKKSAINKIHEKLLEFSTSNPRLKKEITDITNALEEGMSLSGGSRRRVRRRSSISASKRKYRNRKSRGGMPPARKEEVAQAEDPLTETEKNTLLNAISHIIAAGTILGGSGAVSCYIAPAIEAYLIAKGWLPALCQNSVEWGLRMIIGTVISGVDTCMALQTRYNAIILQIVAAVGLPSGAGILLKRQALMGGYTTYKNTIYNVLKSITDNIRSTISAKSMQEAKPELSKEEIKRITDEVIEREFNLEGITPVQAKELADYEKVVLDLEQQVREGEDEEEEDEYTGMPHSWGGKKRRTRRKRKTNKRKTMKKHKRTRTHKNRK